MDVQFEALSKPCKRVREMNILSATLGWTPSAVARNSHSTEWRKMACQGVGEERHAGGGKVPTSTIEMGRIWGCTSLGL